METEHKPYMVLYQDEYNQFNGIHHYTPYGIANDMDGIAKLNMNALANQGRDRDFTFDYKEWTDAQIKEMKGKGELIWDFISPPLQV